MTTEVGQTKGQWETETYSRAKRCTISHSVLLLLTLSLLSLTVAFLHTNLSTVFSPQSSSHRRLPLAPQSLLHTYT